MIRRSERIERTGDGEGEPDEDDNPRFSEAACTVDAIERQLFQVIGGGGVYRIDHNTESSGTLTLPDGSQIPRGGMASDTDEEQDNIYYILGDDVDASSVRVAEDGLHEVADAADLVHGMGLVARKRRVGRYMSA